MQRINKAKDIHQKAVNIRNTGRTIGFVPTMGALHEGHLSLIRQAKAENDVVICSVFVNPTQFNESSDFKSYPRDLEKDASLLEKVDCDILFAPDEQEIYPQPDKTQYILGEISQDLEGKHRPGHFNGVASVVRRLLELCVPHKAYFGLKDYQQYMVIKQLVDSYEIPTKVVGCEIARSAEGLALSSRNALLPAHDLALAPEIYKTMLWAKKQVHSRNINEIEAEASKNLANMGFEVEYFTIRNKFDLKSPLPDRKNDLLVLVAARLGKVRLIDNMTLT
jgi:pantoate--beta-alanine ligase